MTIWTRGRSLLAATILSVLVLGGIACTDDPVCPDFQLGAIEGVVTSAGEPVAGAHVLAFPRESSDNTAEATAVTDSSGRYHLDLPNGLYWVEIQTHRGELYLSAEIDTVRVASDLTRLDFPWGRAEISVGMPAAFEGRSCHLVMDGFPPVGQDAVVIDGMATFSFPLLRPQTYTMRLWSGLVDIAFPAAMSLDDPRDSLVVGPDEPTVYAIDFAATYATLEGRITGGWQQIGGSPPLIRVFSLDSLRLDTFSPDQDGNFTIELLAARDIVLQTDDYYGITRWVGGASCAAATHFTLKPGDHLTGVEIPESRIRLTLRGPSGMVDHDDSVLLINDRGQRFPLPVHLGQDPRIIGNLDAGRWFLQVNGYQTGQTWAAQWYHDADSLQSATPIELASGEGVDLTMDLHRGGSISGQVLMYGGTPSFTVSCTLCDSDGIPLGGPEQPHWFDAPEGRFTIPGLPDGSFFVAAYNPWTRETVWYPGTTDFASAQPVIVDGHGQVTGITFDLGSHQGGQP